MMEDEKELENGLETMAETEDFQIEDDLVEVNSEEVKPKEINLEEMAEVMPETEVGFGDSGDDSTEEEYRERHPFLRAVLSLLTCIVLALILSLVITKYVAYHTSVEGSSMEPTLENEDQLIVEKISYYFHEPERFDVIVFPYSQNVSYIKRIIGLPGETVQIRRGVIYINDEPITENYGKDTIRDAGLARRQIVLEDDEYFVLGDNRNASIDSRRMEVGTIKRSKITGKAWLRFYPFDRFETIE